MSVLHPPCLPPGLARPVPTQSPRWLRLWAPLRDALVARTPPPLQQVRELDDRTRRDIGCAPADPLRPEAGRPANRMPHFW